MSPGDTGTCGIFSGPVCILNPISFEGHVSLMFFSVCKCACLCACGCTASMANYGDKTSTGKI